MTAPATPSQLVAALDPVATLCCGALPYHDAPLAIPDEQPDPGLRVHREVTAPGLRLRIVAHDGVRVVTDEPLEVTTLPLDRARARPRRRIHPAPTGVLLLAADPGDERRRAGIDPDAAGRDGAVTRLLLPRHGPGPSDHEVVLRHALASRTVRIDEPLPGDPVLMAGLLLTLTASGVVCAAPDAVVAPLVWLHPELRAAITAAGTSTRDAAGGDLSPDLSPDLATGVSPDLSPDLAPDDLGLAAAAAAQKRAAWAHHDLELAWEPTAAPATTAPGDASIPAWQPALRQRHRPAVSVVLPSRRPALLPYALAMLAAQREVQVQVVVALHGVGDPAVVQAQLAHHGLAGEVLAVPAAVPFGAVVQAAVARTDAPLVAKWDDDDLYGPWHLLDLVLAQQQTGAGLVGKAPEFVYLDASSTTVWRTPGRAEAPSLGLAGGTFLTPRAALDAIGGYPPVARAIDHHVKTRMEASGHGVFRTHAFGFVLRRHGHGHTWQADDDRYRRQAVRHLEGLPAILDLGDAAVLAPAAALRATTPTATDRA